MLDDQPTNLCQNNGEIFFRESDINRFQRVFDAVVDDSQHLLMTSQFDGVIDHYGKMMLNRLKMRSGMAVETYMPASTEALVTRFNELVNSMSVEEARGDVETTTSGRIVVVNDPKAIDSDGWALLSRMITDFPGLNMRLVFLLDRIPSHIEKALDRFGSRLVRWEVDPPTTDEQLALRKEGMQVGLEFQVERVLSRINQTLSQHLEPALSAQSEQSLNLDLDTALGGATEAGEREADDMRALFEEETPEKKRGGIGFVLLLVVGLGIATFVAGFVSPEVGQQLDRALKLVGVEESIFMRQPEGQSVVDAAYDSSVQKVPVLQELPKLDPLPDESGRLATEQTASPEQALRTEMSNQIAEETTAEASATNVVTPAPVEESPVEQPQTEPPVAEVATQTTESVAVVPPPAPIVEETKPSDPAIELVKTARPNNQFVQHIVLASKARAEAWIATQSGIDRAVVVPVSVNGATRYAVVSGPFENRAESRAYIQGLASGADYWVRTAGSLQRILQDGE